MSSELRSAQLAPTADHRRFGGVTAQANHQTSERREEHHDQSSPKRLHAAECRAEAWSGRWGRSRAAPNTGIGRRQFGHRHRWLVGIAALALLGGLVSSALTGTQAEAATKSTASITMSNWWDLNKDTKISWGDEVSFRWTAPTTTTGYYYASVSCVVLNSNGSTGMVVWSKLVDNGTNYIVWNADASLRPAAITLRTSCDMMVLYSGKSGVRTVTKSTFIMEPAPAGWTIEMSKAAAPVPYYPWVY